MQKTILVTGGTGFIGSNLCARLLDEGHTIYCLDNLYTSSDSNITELKKNSNFHFINHDITRPLPDTLPKFDQIYNLACPASPPAYQKDPIFTWKTSVFGVYNMLEFAKKNGNIPILQASTSEVYGDPLVHPQDESYLGNVNSIGIRSCYDEGKRAAESVCFDYYRQYKTPIRVIRIFNTYGPLMDPYDGRVVSNFIMQGLMNLPITIFGDGSQSRSFQYIDDLLEGMIKMMNNTDSFTGPVNLGNPNEFTVLELAKKILELIPESSSKIEYKKLPGDDPSRRRPDISLAKSKLSWEPKIELEEGLLKTIAYFKTKL
ncbi:MAG: NAD-dependent epimerase/dehydratase [Candidatus Shapirobacteria bacterium GW2011_GWE1_38_10]|uniref:UDP-glucuronate decarboxylase n=1 Tax=Candidatus Shapirobacteria bacterium GW2011_GWE1_38_10 TaxID=1618488 RepID=A0A0G0I745_9BACT|nr:MAG: NAD-dependent epimerase/dehydratase [Candidatus Shapirobacteria bacterium GW2011_GWF2_37_20]KKQ50372.1 MAG: NAD-dependent epimerase/dehydratase [Candidatus Shapirobacteria bacterium GW2011_GWE1_38_10]KKQ65196.1 MAG: NAD-dependent epimerase/dehydratase [Candidatus Shapirobacteria bacterium GW2011_GWF1_38_23]HBP51311.1 NAD-dependent dehydratase [Candidatus Shapirobacteria bacterium]